MKLREGYHKVFFRYTAPGDHLKGRPLTPRNKQVIKAYWEEESVKNAATQLGISNKTVEYHLQCIKWRLDVDSFNPVGLIKKCLKAGVITLCLVLLMGCTIVERVGGTGQPPGTVILIANPPNGGTVSGGGQFPARTVITVSASANSGWSFQNWNDGITAATRTVVVPGPNGRITYTATFTPIAVTTTPITVGWDAVPTATSYKVYQGRSTRNYTNSTVTAATRLQIQVWPGTTYVATTALAGNLESTNYSNEITYSY